MSEVFHLIRVQRKYLTIKPPKTKTMFLTFENLKTAHKCKDYIEQHRTKYGIWPSLDMDKEHELIKYEMDSMNTLEPLYIEKKTLRDIEELMHRSGTGVVYCYDFGMIPNEKSFTITFRAQELEVELDLDKYLECLENTLDS